jgi:hypothetical protein
MGNRMWLPFLQSHIHIFYKLGFPYQIFKLIPCCYFLLALLFLAKLLQRIIGKSYSGFFFTLLILFVFSYQSKLFSLSTSLYQEMPEIAFLYILFYLGALELRKSKSLLFFGSIALFIRETFWVYLLVLTLLNFKKIKSEKIYKFSFIWLFSLIAIWFLAAPYLSFVKFSRLPRWPLMINTESKSIVDLFGSFKSLSQALVNSRVIFILLGLIIILALKYLYFGKAKTTYSQEKNFGSKFKIFSLASLAIIYFYIILFNPYEYTPANPRMIIPLLSHLFIWTALFFKESFNYQRSFKIICCIVLTASLLTIVRLRVDSWVVKDYSDDIKVYAAIQAMSKNIAKVSKPYTCIYGISFWKAIDNFIAPTLYTQKAIIDNQNEPLPDSCNIVITPLLFKLESQRFPSFHKIKIKGQEYLFYLSQDKTSAKH